jgi:eukaryotic-like serine/threonine-protein kinase
MTSARVGTVLVGKYRLEQQIGQGGMGTVWRALHLGLNAPVAVKLLWLPTTQLQAKGEAAPIPAAALQRFHAEAQTAAAIRSPHVVQILDHGVDDAVGAPFIVMELLEGESLAHRLQRETRLSASAAAHLLTHVGRALSRVHEAGLVHRDLKPDNVFLVSNDDEIIAKVLDFGIAKAQLNALSSGMTRTGDVMGTPYYMSPEQLRGSKDVDLGTDLWAFGVMACECVTGLRPFDAETYSGLTLKICVEPIALPSSLGSVPRGFDAWFLRCVERDPKARFASARDMIQSLRDVLTTPQSVPSRADDLGPTVALSKSDVLGPLFAPSRSTTSIPVSSGDSSPSSTSGRSTDTSRDAWLVAGVAACFVVGGGSWFLLRDSAPEVAAVGSLAAEKGASPSSESSPSDATLSVASGNSTPSLRAALSLSSLPALPAAAPIPTVSPNLEPQGVASSLPKAVTPKPAAAPKPVVAAPVQPKPAVPVAPARKATDIPDERY